ncbi:hypothetical protein AMECASPLE_015626 [Ameca splendens]|uniref:Uncharacterized protein n=1 Tax=Ameca splendens TaxID=208324 RepID=A0ABV0YPC1_9TELE
MNTLQHTPLLPAMVAFYAQRDVRFLELVRIGAGLYSDHKRTAPESVWKRTETTSKSGSQPGYLVRTRISLSVFTPAQKVRTKGGNELWSVSSGPKVANVNTPSVNVLMFYVSH